MAYIVTPDLGLELADPATIQAFETPVVNEDFLKLEAGIIADRVRMDAELKPLHEGLSLSSEDLDAVLVPGTYVQLLTGSSTLARHYPFEGCRGILSVEAAGTSYKQRFHYWLNPTNTAIYERTKITTNVWTPWRMVFPFAGLLPSALSAGATSDHKGLITLTSAAELIVQGVFTADFQSYEIIFDLDTAGTAGLNLRLALAGVAAATAVYDNQRTTSVGATVGTVQAFDVTDMQFSPINLIARHSGRLVLHKPAVAANTRYEAQSTVMPAAPGATSGHSFASGQHVAATAYDGFRIAPSTGNFSGTVSVKGIA